MAGSSPAMTPIEPLLDQALFLVIADRAGMQRNRAAGRGRLQLDLLAGRMRVRQFRERLIDQLGHLVGQIVGDRRTGHEIIDDRGGRDVLVLAGIGIGGVRPPPPGGARLFAPPPLNPPPRGILSVSRHPPPRHTPPLPPPTLPPRPPP